MTTTLHLDINPPLNGLWTTKGKYGDESMMLKTVMEVAQYYTNFNYGPLIPQKDSNYQDITIVAGEQMKPAPKIFIPGYSKEKFSKEPPPRCVDHLLLGKIIGHHSG